MEKIESPHNNDRYRHLSSEEKSILIKQGNYAQSWDSIMVADEFIPDHVSNCRFFGNIKIGAIKKGFLDRSGFSIPLGLYNSTFVDCTIGHFVAINNLQYCSHYEIGHEVLIHNVGELVSSSSAKFGNGISKCGDYSCIDLINENGGRAIIPFDGIICPDAFLWAKYRENKDFIKRLEQITDTTCSVYYGLNAQIGSESVLRNIKSIRDSKIGKNAIIDSAEVILNTTIRSDDIESSFIGAGVQLRNTLIGFGNRIDSGTQLNSVVTGNNVSISQSARIMHSYIGDNSAISCCEIAHCLLFPSHAQHHNNSFLIASAIGGQCNIAAGATIGSNHNSRVNDGEIWASRGFWPGLCTSLKHNSKFASYTMLVKGDYPSELNIPFPFSLGVNNISRNCLLLFPAYWFYCNMYALMRSRLKFSKRDKRIHKDQIIEHDPLAPDTVEEMFKAVKLLEIAVGENWFRKNGGKVPSMQECEYKGKTLFEHNGYIPEELESFLKIERGNRPVFIKHAFQARKSYLEMIRWYSVKTIIDFSDLASFDFSVPLREKNWINCGGQIWAEKDLTDLIDKIVIDSSVSTWDDIHAIYNNYESRYNELKIRHALGCLATLEGVEPQKFNSSTLKIAIEKAIPICEQIVRNTRLSRSKDFDDPFRTMIYDTEKELNAVLGDIDDDSTISEIEQESKNMIETIRTMIKS